MDEKFHVAFPLLVAVIGIVFVVLGDKTAGISMVTFSIGYVLSGKFY